MKLTPAILLLVVPAMAASAASFAKIKIGTVPNEYTPTNATVREPVSMKDFHFEVNQETIRARIVVDYTYPDELVYGPDDAGKGPQPTVAQIPGLKYDPQAHVIVYETSGKQTICANVEEQKGLFGRHLNIKNTGFCVVTAEDTKHAEDDGWNIHHSRVLDTYFEVR